MRTLAVILFAGTLAFGQASPGPLTSSSPTRDPVAVTLAGQAVASAAGSMAISDITLQGTVTYTAGSDTETGTATLEATSRDESLVTLNLSGGSRQWVRQGPAGAWTGPDGQPHAMAIHNCWADAAWFFPALSMEAALGNPTVGLSYGGSGMWQGASVQHVQWSNVPPGQSAQTAAAVQQLSATDVYLDASSLLPLALDFNVHPDEDAGQNLPVEIRFSDYQVVSGVAFHTTSRKFFKGAYCWTLR